MYNKIITTLYTFVMLLNCKLWLFWWLVEVLLIDTRSILTLDQQFYICRKEKFIESSRAL